MLQRISIVILLISSFVFSLKSQDYDFDLTLTLGLSSTILDNGLGFHAGVNPHWDLGSHFAVGAQVSYIYTRISSTFISGGTGTANSINTLLGGRIYFLDRSHRIRPYFQLMAGLQYRTENTSGILMTDTGWLFGGTGGAFVDFDGIVAGLAYESPNNVILKAGYNF